MFPEFLMQGKLGADKSTKAESVLISNMLAAIGIADTLRTSLGPRGMDKMVSLLYCIFYFFEDNWWK
jgi:hypothetical protein